MSDFWRAALGLFAAASPLGALPVFVALAGDEAAGRRVRLALLGSGVSFTLMAAAALVNDPFLDSLDISPENFQLAAGAVMAPLALRLLWFGNSMSPREVAASRVAWFVPLAAPLLAGPPSLVGALSYGARFGEGTAVGAAALAVAVSAVVLALGPWLSRRIGHLGVSSLGRLSGALLAIVAIELVLDGLTSV